MSYIYRREDNGELVEVDFATAMSQDCGYITLPDGVLARRCVALEEQEVSQQREISKKVKAAIVSDAMGVTGHQVETFRRDAAEHGFTGIEFKTDPIEPTFFQCHASSWAEWNRYLKHRGLRDKNSRNGGGQALTPAMLARASQRLLETSDAA